MHSVSSSCICDNTTPILWISSICVQDKYFRTIWNARIGADTKRCLRFSKPSWHLVLHWKGVVLSIRWWRGFAISAKLWTNQLARPKNCCTLRRDLGTGNQLVTISVFTGSVATPLVETMCPWNSTFSWHSTHLESLSFKPASLNWSKTAFRLVKCLSNVLPMQDNHVIQIDKAVCPLQSGKDRVHEVLECGRCNIYTQPNSNSPSGVQKAIFWRSSWWTSTFQ